MFILPHFLSLWQLPGNKGIGRVILQKWSHTVPVSRRSAFLPNNTSCLFLHVSQLRTNSFFSNCLLYHRLPGPQTIQPFILSSTGIRDAISFSPPHRCQKHLGMPLPESSEFPEQSLDNGNLTLQRWSSQHSSCHMSVCGGYTLRFVGMPSKKLTSSNHMLQTLFSSRLIRKYNLVKVYPHRPEQETESDSDGSRGFK